MLQVSKINGLYYITHIHSDLCYKYCFISREQARMTALKLQTSMEKGTESKDLKTNFIPLLENSRVVDGYYRLISV